MRHVPIMIKLISVFGLLLIPLAPEAARTLDKHIGWPGNTLAGYPCYGKPQRFGPFDYLDPEAARDGKYGKSPRALVEGAHFTQKIEQLISGRHGIVDPAGDIDYTLRAFPNHHRALWAMSRYYLRKLNTLGVEQMRTGEQSQTGLPPPECYFQRAKAFAAEDRMISAVFGIYLHRRGQLNASLAEYKLAEAEHADQPEIVYNMGLLYCDLDQLDEARVYAERASALGYPLDGLSRKISRIEAGKQSDSPTVSKD